MFMSPKMSDLDFTDLHDLYKVQVFSHSSTEGGDVFALP